MTALIDRRLTSWVVLMNRGEIRAAVAELQRQGRPCADLTIANDASPFDVRQV